MRCSPVKINRRFGGTLHLFSRSNRALLATCLMLVSRLAYNSTLKMEAICCPEKCLTFTELRLSYGMDDRGVGVLFLAGETDFSLLHNVQTRTGAHTGSYKMRTGEGGCLPKIAQG
jgi:hypothetical protein